MCVFNHKMPFDVRLKDEDVYVSVANANNQFKVIRPSMVGNLALMSHLIVNIECDKW